MTATNRPALVAKVAANWPAHAWRDVTVLVAVSSGADSVALARALVAMRDPGDGRLVLGHFNHRLRGAESDTDEEFVRQLGRELGVEVVVGTREADRESSPSAVRAVIQEQKPSEESLRAQRYAFLIQAAGQLGARYVATAHTADDQVETVLANLVRGTGLAGLAGIPRVRQLSPSAVLIRPLLEVSRAEVLDYLRQIAQPFREDVTNASIDYTRNRIRHELLPQLARDYNPQVREAVLRLSRLAGEADDEITGLAAEIAERAVRPVPGGIEIPLDVLAKRSDFLARSVLRAAWRSQGWPEQGMGLAEWQALAELARNPTTPPRSFPGAIRAETAGGMLQLSRQ
jgi:tRNA(Ile)-lysidine synthase